jgi:ribosomal protein S18 acetylase RimI-like enzyme
MVTDEWSDWRNGFMWWIQSVYVTEDTRRAGVFSALYQHVEALARKEPNCCGIRLFVESENKKAQDTYLAVGMVDPGYLVMETDFRKNEDTTQE